MVVFIPKLGQGEPIVYHDKLELDKIREFLKEHSSDYRAYLEKNLDYHSEL